MAPFWLRLRADIRLRWRPMLSLALLLGIVGGVVLAAAAGARRTDTAYPRLLSWASAAQVDIIPEGDGAGFGGYYQALARLPQVEAMTTQIGYQLALPVSRGNPDSPVDAWFPHGQPTGVPVADRLKILQGRPLNAKDGGQVMIDQRLADIEHLRPGGTLRLVAVPNTLQGLPEFSKERTLTFTVTAIVAFDDQIVRTGTGASIPQVELSPAFATVGSQRYTFGDEAAVRLRPGASAGSFIAAAQKLARNYPSMGGVNAVSRADQVTATQQAIRPQAIALAAFVALAGLIALAVVGQLLSRQLTMDSGEFGVLRALGMARASLVALSLARIAAVTVTGAVIARKHRGAGAQRARGRRGGGGGRDGGACLRH